MAIRPYRSAAVLLATLASCAAPGCGGGDDAPIEVDAGDGATLDTAPSDTSESEGDSALVDDTAPSDTGSAETSGDADEEASVDSGAVDSAVDSTDTAVVVVDTAVVDPDTGSAADTTVIDPDTGTLDTGTVIVVDSAPEAEPDTAVPDTAVPDTAGPPTTMALSLGGAHSCAVKTDFTLGCWGRNNQGQLGLPVVASTSSPPGTPLLTNALSVGAGDQQSCALMVDGTVKCWGYYFYGSLGDGRTSTTSTADHDHNPVDVTGVSGALKLVVGHLHACVQLPDFKAKCWGYNSDGQVGNQSTSPNKVPLATPIKDIAGTGEMTGIVELALGRAHTCARMLDNTVLCWGYNFYGNLGDGTTTNRTKPAPVTGLTDVAQIAAGYNHNCARHLDGTVSCWGSHWYGAVGDGSPMGTSTPTAKKTLAVKVPGITNAVQLALGENLSCARLSTGEVKCWGWGSDGALGSGTIAHSNVPVTVAGLGFATDLVAGYRHVCAKSFDGSRRCWGSDGDGQLGIGTVTDYNTPSRNPGLSSVAQIAMGRSSAGGHGCAAMTDKSLKCWGRGREGQTANGGLLDTFTPVAVPGLSVEQLVAGQNHTCALLTGGSVACFGDANYGVLGGGGAAPTAVTPTATPVAVTGISTAKQLAAGHRFNCALLTDGTVSCWGRNDQGQLVDGTTTNSATPKTIAALAGITSIAAGGEHACAISGLDKSVSCWGENDNKQAGNPSSTTDVKAAPVKLALPAGTEPVKLALGENHTCVLLNDKTVACFGDNQYGQLGTGTTTDVASPTVIAGLTGVADLWAGDNFTCARLDSGAYRCWGFNQNGQLADGSFDDRSTPGAAILGLSNIADLALGRGSNCAKLADGTARCWGGIYFGALGDGQSEYRPTPVLVSY